jgi:hypothetical protein
MATLHNVNQVIGPVNNQDEFSHCFKLHVNENDLLPKCSSSANEDMDDPQVKKGYVKNEETYVIQRMGYMKTNKIDGQAKQSYMRNPKLQHKFQLHMDHLIG